MGKVNRLGHFHFGQLGHYHFGVTLINVATDMTAVIAKPLTADTIVPGGTIVNAQKDVLAASALKVNGSVAGAFDVYVMAVKV